MNQTGRYQGVEKTVLGKDGKSLHPCSTVVTVLAKDPQEVVF